MRQGGLHCNIHYVGKASKVVFRPTPTINNSEVTNKRMEALSTVMPII
jgi:hypothetical protein